MNSIVVISAASARSPLATERLNARRLEAAINEIRETGRQEAAQKTGQTAEGARQSETARQSIVEAFTASRGLAGRLVREAVNEAGADARSAGGNQTGEAVLKAADGASGVRASNELSEEEKQIVREMRARDQEVRAHEQAHKAVGGRHAGAISYEYQQGPDGQRYAVAGQVPIDISPESDPQATADKMTIVIAAALAPAEPSPQDRAVAQQAQAQRTQALAEARQEKQEEMQGRTDETAASSALEAANGRAPNALQHNPYDQLANENARIAQNILSAIA